MGQNKKNVEHKINGDDDSVGAIRLHFPINPVISLNKISIFKVFKRNDMMMLLVDKVVHTNTTQKAQRDNLSAQGQRTLYYIISTTRLTSN